MKIQLVLFIIGFVIMSLLPIAMKRGNGSSDVMILLMLAVNFLAFFYQDRFRRNNKNYLAQGLYLIRPDCIHGRTDPGGHPLPGKSVFLNQPPDSESGG